MIRVADYIADFLYRNGAEDVFMLAGGGSIYLDDAIACHEKLKHVAVRNEATAPMMAEAYARLSQGIGGVIVTTGPGGMNAASGLVEAWVDSAPIIVISGQVPRNQASYSANVKGLRSFGIQELNIVEVVKSITKYADMVSEPDEIRYHLEKALYLAKSGRPGPVWLDIPLDVQSAMVDEDKLKEFFPPEEPPPPSDLDSKIDQIIELLKKSERPLVIGGHGIRIAGVIDKFEKLLQQLNLPVIFSRLGQDILPYSHKNNFGQGGMYGSKFSGKIMKESDLVIALGSRLAVPFIGREFDAFADDAKIVMVDLDKAELEKPTLDIHLPIRADLKHVVPRLLDRSREVSLPDYGDWIATCTDYKEKNPIITKEMERNPIDLYYFVSRLDALSQEGDIFVSDSGSSYYATGQALKFERGQREITSGAYASMGLTIPLAIGCSTRDRNARILAITGDGSLESNLQELKTMSYYKMNIKLFIINNGGYLSIRDHQDKLFDGRHINSVQGEDDELLDFKKIADAFNLPYFNIQRYEELDDKIKEVLDKEGPVFVEVMCDNKQNIVKSSDAQ